MVMNKRIIRIIQIQNFVYKNVFTYLHNPGWCHIQSGPWIPDDVAVKGELTGLEKWTMVSA